MEKMLGIEKQVHLGNLDGRKWVSLSPVCIKPISPTYFELEKGMPQNRDSSSPSQKLNKESSLSIDEPKQSGAIKCYQTEAGIEQIRTMQLES